MGSHGLRFNVSASPSSSRLALLLQRRAFQPVRYVSASAGHQTSVFAVLVDDKTVPEAHKGLHGFLYGDGGSEAHEQDKVYAARQGEDEGAVVMPVAVYLESRDGEKPLGVYCVYDSQHNPQYIGYSRNVVLAIKGHLARVGPERCAHVRAMVYGNRAMTSRANLERGMQTWVHELLNGQVPPGNTDPHQRAAWEGSAAPPPHEGETPGEGGAVASPAVLDRRLMSPAEQAAYEEKKLKLRKAMGEKMVRGPGGAGSTAASDRGDDHHHHQEEEEEEDDPATRRLKLMQAMNRGDWSAVIHAQTQETLGGEGTSATSAGEGASTAATSGDGGGGGSSNGEGASGNEAAGSTESGGEASSAAPAIVSPFQAAATGTGASGGGGGGRPQQPLTVEAVQSALEEVRPYLMADGGDVEVVNVDGGIVYLRLQGACSSCPSQSATMKGGIERVIKQNFGDQVRDILQLDAVDPGASVERVDSALNMLRGAIYNFGGSVEVLSVQDGVCTIRYKGPPAIGKGVQGAVKDTFSDLREVRLVD